jgi:hypothetical protein
LGLNFEPYAKGELATDEEDARRGHFGMWKGLLHCASCFPPLEWQSHPARAGMSAGCTGKLFPDIIGMPAGCESSPEANLSRCVG